MKKRIGKKGLLTILFLVFLVVQAASAGANEFRRAGRVEFFGVAQMMNGDTSTFFDGGISLKFDDTSLYGFGAGFNFTDNFNLNTDFLFGSTDVDISDGIDTIRVDGDLVLWNVNLDYSILKERLTPVVSAGIGFFNSGTTNTFPNVDETDFSYNAGIGVRWDALDNLFFKAMYRWTWTELEDADDSMLFDGLSVFVGLMF